MARKFPRNYDSIGDPTRTETTVPEIRGAGTGKTFRKDGETFEEMLQRKKNLSNSKSSSSTKENPKEETKEIKKVQELNHESVKGKEQNDNIKRKELEKDIEK